MGHHDNSKCDFEFYVIVFVGKRKKRLGQNHNAFDFKQ